MGGPVNFLNQNGNSAERLAKLFSSWFNFSRPSLAFVGLLIRTISEPHGILWIF
jgi:hypothetical protein